MSWAGSERSLSVPKSRKLAKRQQLWSSRWQRMRLWESMRKSRRRQLILGTPNREKSERGWWRSSKRQSRHRTQHLVWRLNKVRLRRTSYPRLSRRNKIMSDSKKRWTGTLKGCRCSKRTSTRWRSKFSSIDKDSFRRTSSRPNFLQPLLRLELMGRQLGHWPTTSFARRLVLRSLRRTTTKATRSDWESPSESIWQKWKCCGAKSLRLRSKRRNAKQKLRAGKRRSGRSSVNLSSSARFARARWRSQSRSPLEILNRPFKRWSRYADCSCQATITRRKLPIKSKLSQSGTLINRIRPLVIARILKIDSLNNTSRWSKTVRLHWQRSKKPCLPQATSSTSSKSPKPPIVNKNHLIASLGRP